MLGASNHRQFKGALQFDVRGELGKPAGFDQAEGLGCETPIIPAAAAGLTASGVVSPRRNFAARFTASKIFTYPVQRHRLRASAFFMVSLSGSGSRSRSAFVAMIMPGVQNPHWTAPASTKASWTRWGLSGVPRPSTVITSAPSRSATLVRQDNTAFFVDDYGAGAALALAVAGLLGSHQMQVLAQKIQKNPVRRHHELIISSIYLK